MTNLQNFQITDEYLYFFVSIWMKYVLVVVVVVDTLCLRNYRLRIDRHLTDTYILFI